MRPRRIQLLAACSIVALATPVRSAEIWTGPIDNVAFQALVDGAEAGDTLVLGGGVYDFTTHAPVKVRKALSIVAENPENPPVFEGSGEYFTPVEDGNNAFLVRKLGSDIRGLEFTGLEFRKFDRALAFSPEFDAAGCVVPDSGTLSQLAIRNCRVSASRRAVQIWSGRVEHFDIRENVLDVWHAGVLVISSAVLDPCSPSGIAILRGLKDGLILGNEVTAGTMGIFVAGGERLLITGNAVAADVIGIGLGDDAGLFSSEVGPARRVGSVVGNTVSGSSIGLGGFGPTEMSGVSFTGNSVTDSYVGTLLEQGANHYLVADTTNVGNLFVDFLLGVDPFFFAFPPATYANRVIAGFGDTVWDGGVGNSIDGAYNLIENPQVPDEVKARLAALASALEALRVP